MGRESFRRIGTNRLLLMLRPVGLALRGATLSQGERVSFAGIQDDSEANLIAVVFGITAAAPPDEGYVVVLA